MGNVYETSDTYFKGQKKTSEEYAALEADKLTLSEMKRVTYGRNT